MTASVLKQDGNTLKVKKKPTIYYDKTQHARFLASAGHPNNVTKQLHQKQTSILHLIFRRLTVVL